MGNIIRKFLDKIKKIWERLGEPDIENHVEYGNGIAGEVEKIIAEQEKIRKNRTVVKKERINTKEALNNLGKKAEEPRVEEKEITN